MKIFFFLVFIFFAVFNGAAQQNNSVYFGQCLLDIESNEEIVELEATMRQNPLLKIVRLDLSTKRAFIITNSLDGLTEEQFSSWFSEYGDSIRCVQIGVNGVDAVKPYPFVDCNN